MNETKHIREHLQYNKMGWDIKNIVFDPRQLFDSCQNFIDPGYPSHSHSLQNFESGHFFDLHQNVMDPLHPHQPQHFFYQHHFFDPHQNFMDQTNQRHPHHNFIHTNHEPKLFSKLLLTQITGLRLHKTNNILLKSFV